MPKQPKQPLKVKAVEAGSTWRLAWVVRPGDRAPTESGFKTDRIENGNRHGSVAVLVIEVCPGGCCAFIRTPLGVAQVETIKLREDS